MDDGRTSHFGQASVRSVAIWPRAVAIVTGRSHVGHVRDRSAATLGCFEVRSRLVTLGAVSGTFTGSVPSRVASGPYGSLVEGGG